MQADSIYTEFLIKSEDRFKSGDVDAVEFSTASNQRAQIAAQLSLLQTDYEVALNRFNILLNGSQKFAPDAKDVIYTLSAVPDAAKLEDSPLLKLQQHQVTLSQQEQRLEKSKLMPSLNVGYSNTSLVGWQTNAAGQDVYYGRDKRFSSVNVGVGIPLFFGAQRARIKASNILIRQRQEELSVGRQQLNAQLEDATKVYVQRNQLISTYTQSILPNASKIIALTTDKLNAGEIGYLDWVILVNQSIQVRTEYFNTIQQQNEAAFEIEKISAIK